MATLNDIYPIPHNVLSSNAFQQLDISTFTNNYADLIKKFKNAIETGEKFKGLFEVGWEYIFDGKLDTLEVIKGFLSVLSLVPEVGTFAAGASTIVGFLWPKLFGKNEAKDLFEEFKPKIEKMIQEDLNKYQNVVTKAKFDGVKDVMESYNKAIDSNDKEEIKRQITSIHINFLSKIGEFIPEDYEEIGLPYFTLTANFHMLVLKDAVVNAAELNSSPDEANVYRSLYLQYLKDAINSYTKKVNEKFLTALEKYPVSDVNSYNKRAIFIQGMTEMVLDIVALWPTFDPTAYTKQTDIEFTRTILSSIQQPTKYPISSSSLVPSQNLFYGGELAALQFSTWGTEWSDVFTGIRNTLWKGSETEKNNLDFSYDTQSGSNISKGSTAPLEIDNSNPIISTSFTNTFYNKVMASSFTANFANKTSDGISINGPLGGAWDSGYTKSDSAPEGHKLNYIYTAPTGTLRDFINVYIPMNTPGINELSATKIKGFPAEKGYIANDKGELTYYGKSEIINGAQPIDLKYQQILALPFQSSKTGTYTIRIRYASTQGTQAYFRLSDSDNMKTINIPSSHKNGYVMGNIGKYYDFYVIGAYTIKEGNHTLYLQHNDESEMILDRIEFIPIASAESIIKGVIEPVSSGQEQTVWNGIGIAGNYTITLDNPGTLYSTYLITAYSENGTAVGTALLINTDTISINDMFSKISIMTIIPDTIPFEFSLQLQNQNPPNFMEEKDLSNITNQVNNLFASSAQDALANNVSDYWIEQVVMKVDALSNEVFGKEKKALRKLVNQAKRLSKARNLLIGGNFDQLDAWYTGKDVVKESDHELFKSDHILLPPPTFNPSYIFQKIEESKLKPNMRYTVSGFIAHGEDVELIISRYGQEIKKIMQVPYGETLPFTSGSSSSCCIPRSTVNGHPADPHFFSYSIDVGSLEMETNIGIEFGLRIVEPTGMARVGNLEIREDRPLTTKETRQVQRAANDWKKSYEQERTEVIAVIQPILNQINALYENENWNGPIRSTISYHDLENIVLPTLPKMRHWFMTDRMGEHASILSHFQEALDRAYTQLESHNLLHNGHFTTNLTRWIIEGNAHHTLLEDRKHVLRLPDWSSSLTQTIEIEDFDPDQEYQLVIHAKGEGTVTLQHGEEGESVKVHFHDTNSFTTSRSTPITFDTNTVTVDITSEDGEFLVDHISLVEVSEQNTTGNPTIVSNNANIGIPYRL